MSEAQLWEKVWEETAAVETPPDKNLRTNVTLKKDGKEYRVHMDHGLGYEVAVALYFWEEGNFGCDCNRRLWIEKFHPGAVKPTPEVCDSITNPCGETIEVTAFNLEFTEKMSD